MKYTTFAKLKELGACPEGYRKLAQSLGGVKHYGEDTLIPLSKILDSNGLDDAIWTLRCTTEPSDDFIIEFACRCAESILKHYETVHPGDKRPRKAIEAARHCIADKSAAARAAAWAAGDAAWAAARDAGDAARDAARDAASAAARDAGDAASAAARDAALEWQAQQFREMLEVTK